MRRVNPRTVSVEQFLEIWEEIKQVELLLDVHGVKVNLIFDFVVDLGYMLRDVTVLKVTEEMKAWRMGSDWIADVIRIDFENGDGPLPNHPEIQALKKKYDNFMNAPWPPLHWDALYDD